MPAPGQVTRREPTASLGLRIEKARKLSRARSRCFGGKRLLVVRSILAPTLPATFWAVRTTADMFGLCFGLNG